MCADLGALREEIRRSARTQAIAQLAAGLAHQLRNSLTGARMSIQLHARRHPAAAGDGTLAEEVVGPGAAFHYPPGTVHRVTALDDTTILEVSTPHLDDVVRLVARHARD